MTRGNDALPVHDDRTPEPPLPGGSASPDLGPATRRSLDVALHHILKHRSGERWQTDLRTVQHTGRALDAPPGWEAADARRTGTGTRLILDGGDGGPPDGAQCLALLAAGWGRRWDVSLVQLQDAADYLVAGAGGPPGPVAELPRSLQGLAEEPLAELRALRS